MTNQKQRIFSWMAVAVWMVVIFLFSAQTADNSDDTSGAVVRWVVGLFYRNFDTLPQLRQTQILDAWSTLVRKGAHFTEFAILAMLLSNAIRLYPVAKGLRRLLPVAGSAFYAVTDEVHQHFVPGRACMLVDVGIDTAGAVFGTALVALAMYWIRKYQKRIHP